jgi:Fic family protein
MLLGEARSKIAHIAGSLLNPQVAREMHIVYLTKGALATTAIEGNTLSEDEARRRIERDLDLPPSREYLGREIDNVIAAYNEIKDELVAAVAPPMTRATIENYNRLILADLELDEGVVPGEIPTYSVAVGGYLAAPREDCEFLLERLSEWLNGPDFAPRSPGWELPMAIVKAIVAHLYIAWIHPFGDGNGRTARLMELRILLEAGVPTPATHLLSNHYNQTRTEYYRQLRDASRGEGDILPFVSYALQGFVDGLREQLGVIRSQQFADRWEQYVYQRFGRTTTPARMRQRQLVLEMSKIEGPFSKGELRTLSPGLVEMYHGKTDKTLSRDINALLELELLRRRGNAYAPNKQIIEAFRPVTAERNESA